jgi:hypothetical protein
MSDRGSANYSRFQVLTEGRPAWTQGDRGAVFSFDGLRFWRSTREGKSRIVASWQAPSYGWEHESQCSCVLCCREQVQHQLV